ncbi:transporter [Ganoderma sinense ZZ0214-1]|uniref:Transporter n=1 Tax=Ganoderma sinense ZZ0214-1 TaxID=1077348 RepID=A0A2G8RPR3_9APHY|nr:transporter [Ganoderma sinense ZZ0214-1]
MSDGRGMPLLSGPAPEYTVNEASCRKCNKEFNILFVRSRKCNHCGYSYCHSCADYQALMPRRGDSGAGTTVGYDPLPVCAFCIEMLQITAGGKGQLKQLPMAKLKKYAKAYNINVAGILEKDDFVDKLMASRRPDGCLPHAHESYYRRNSVPNRASNRPRGIFTRAMDAMSGERATSSSSPPPQPQPQYQQRPQHQQYPQYAQYQPRQRTTSGPSRYNPHSHVDPRSQHQYRPPPQQAPRPSQTSTPPRPTPSSRPDQLNVPPQASTRPRASSASSPRAASSSPPRPVVVPSIDQLLAMSNEQVAALSIGSLKEILFKNHVTARLIVEKGELVSRVKTLVEEERVERERKAREQEAERQYEAQMRTAREASSSSPVPSPAPTESREGVQMPVPQPAAPAGPAFPRAESSSSPPKRVVTPQPTSTLPPNAQAMASRLERTGLCVICQDEEANIAVVDCGHLAMCRECSDLIMNSTRECPLCRTRIVTESRLLRIFKS